MLLSFMKVGTQMKKSSYRSILFISILILIFSLFAAVTFGPVKISIQQVYTVIFEKIRHVDSTVRKSTHDIVWLIRLPRVILALVIGIGLSTSGCIMQAIVKNPIAGPYVLGVSSGASLGATLAILFGLKAVFGANSVGFFAFLGAVGVSFLVQIIANIGGKSNSVKLLLSGMAISAVCSAIASFSIFMINDKNATGSITFWLMGSLGGANWHLLKIIFPIIIGTTLFFITQSRILDLMLLGDEISITLGINLNHYRHVYLVCTALIVGFCVYACGMIGFVGLIIPHIVRMIFGTNHKHLLPMSAIIGAIFLIWSDVLCRIILKHGEMPIGVLISLIGTPLFVHLMVAKKYNFGGNESC